MEWIDTPESSNVNRFSYDPQEKTLTVEFRSGKSYTYQDIDKKLFDSLASAPSKGKFLIKNVIGNHKVLKVNT